MTSDGKRVGGQRCLCLWIIKMDNSAIALDHVDLFDARNGVHADFLQYRLQFLVVGAWCLVQHLLLASRCALAANTHLRLQFLQFLDVHFVCEQTINSNLFFHKSTNSVQI